MGDILRLHRLTGAPPPLHKAPGAVHSVWFPLILLLAAAALVYVAVDGPLPAVELPDGRGQIDTARLLK